MNYPCIDRRRFLLVSLAAAAAQAPIAMAQPARVYRLGIMIPGAAAPSDRASMPFLVPTALRELGYVEGKNLVVERRNAGGQRARLSSLAREMIAWRADVIVAVSNEAVQAAKDVTNTVPIVMIGGSVVAEGIVASLAEPGGNITGVVITETTLAAKRLEFLEAAAPHATRVAVLATADEYQEPQLQEAQEAAPALGVTLIVVAVESGNYLNAFQRIVSERAQALLVLSSPLLHRDRSRIIALAARHRLPAIYQWRQHAEEGGLMAFGSNLAELSRRMAFYIDRIFKGAKPAELAVEQPTLYELVINLKTAKTLGLTIPPSLLARVDQIIQ